MSLMFKTEDWIHYFCKYEDNFEGLFDQLMANYYGFVDDSWFDYPYIPKGDV